jgi:predicted metal-binding membrane protein
MLAVDRTSTIAVSALAIATVIAWAGLLWFPQSMDLAGFLAGWTLMMAAMMLPSIAPLVLLYRGSRLMMSAGYLLVWGLVGLIPYWAMEFTMTANPRRAGVVLAAAGVYELTPLKTACLRHCQSPATFLLQRFTLKPFRLGVEHAIWCLGCCLGLMAVLVFAAAMDLRLAAALTAVVFAQKVLPFGSRSALVVGVLLLVAALVVGLSV